MALVILLKDVPKVGQKGHVKEVKDGFFRHFLSPNKLAELATPNMIKIQEEKLMGKKAEKVRVEKEGFWELSKLSEIKLEFNAKATKKGGLYKGISAEDIGEKISEKGFKAIKVEWIKIKTPIKKIGEHKIEILTPSGEWAEIKIEVKPL